MKGKLNLVIATVGGVCVGIIVAYFGILKLKWLGVFAMALCYPVFVAMVGSLKYALTATLIFSLSLQMSYNPWYSDYYVTTHPGIRITLTILILITIYLLWLFRVLYRIEKIKLYPSITIPVAILFIWAGFTYFYAAKPSFFLFQFLQALEGFLIYFYAANFLKSSKDVDFIITWLSITIIATSLITIGQYIKPDFLNLTFMGWFDEPQKLNFAGKIVTRPSAFMGHPNILASFLSVWLPLLFIRSIGFEERSYRHILYLIAFSLGVVALVLTLSRNGWLTFIFALTLIIAFFLRKDLRKKLPQIMPRIIALALLGLIAILPLSPHIYHRMTQGDLGAIESRFKLAKAAWKFIMESPWMGYGLGYYADFKPLPPHEVGYYADISSVPPHNVFLQIIVELGIVGLVFLLWGSIAFFKQGIKALKIKDATMLLFAIGLLVGLSGAYLNAMFEPGTLGYRKFLMIFFMGGLLVGLAHYQKMEGSASSRVSLPKRPKVMESSLQQALSLPPS